MKSQHTTFHVGGPERGVPILDYLARRLDISKKKAKQMLDARAVFVNNQRVWMARHVMQRDDIVEVNLPVAPARAAGGGLHALYEDDDYLIIDKPAGLLSDGPNSAESRLRKQFNNPQIEAVHRIDRETSGCLLFARHAKARDAAVAIFEQRGVRKTYVALVHGRFPYEIRVIDKPLEHQHAITHVRVVRANDVASLLELHPETGRTHQIRKHLAGLRHPILSDKVYATTPIDHPALRRIPRQMLHAAGLEFAHPATGARISVKAREPADFIAAIRGLRLS
ncbi:MAG: RluA family pseudouridine synthase [bacterium]